MGISQEYGEEKERRKNDSVKKNLGARVS